MASRARRQRMLAAFWLLWPVVLLAVYYKQLWHLFVVGPSAWVADNYSLAFVPALWYLVAAGPSAWSLPALGEALTRAMAAVFGSGLVLLAAQVLGISICRLLHWYPADWREGLLYRTAIGLGAISYLSLGLAALGLYYAVNVQILIAVVLLGGGLWLVYSRVRSGFGGQQVEVLTKPASTGHYRAGDKVWQAIVLLAVLIAFVGALAPEIEYDALWYHLWLPKLWLEQGRPVDVIAEFISLYPLAWDLIFGAGLVLGGPVAAKLLHFILLPLTGLLVYQLTRRFVPRGSPWLAVAFFVTIPTVLWEATTAYVDLALAMHVGLVVYALLRYVEERSWQWFALAVLNLGLALATKHLGLFVLAITTTGLALRLWIEDRSLRRALVPAVLLGLLSLLLPLPWYLRSWLASGNPVFPDLYVIFGALPPERWNEISEQGWRHFEAQFGRPRTAFNQLTLLWDMTVHAARYGGTFGPLLLLLLPALALLRRRSRVIPWLVAFVLVYIGLWSSPLNGLEIRFLIPLTPLMAVLAAEASDRLALLLRSTLARWGGRAFQGGLTVLLLFNLPPFTSLHEGDRVVWDGWLTHVIHRVPISAVIGKESQEEYLVRSLPSYAAWRHINTHLPADARVLTFSGGDHFYSDRERLWSDATMAHPAVWGASRGQEKQALQALSELDISYILFDKRQLDSLKPGTLAIAQLSELANWYDLEYEDSNFALYRLNWEQTMLQLAEFFANNPLVIQEIHYHMPEASEVFLVWGINGWAIVPEEIRPAGTVVKDAVMHTPMLREGDTFIAKVQVLANTTIDYGFLITKTSSGAAVHVWEANDDQDYHTIAAQDGVVEVKTTLMLAQNQIPAGVPEAGLPLLIGLGTVFAVGTMLIIRKNSTTIKAPLYTRQLIYLRDLLREMVARDMKLRYKRSILGVAWSLLNPLIQMLVFIFLFRQVLPLDIPNYPSFVFTGVLAWNWFQAALVLATGAITDNRELIRRPGFPTAILPVITVMTHLIHFLLALPVLLLFLVLGGGRLTSAILALPLVIVLQFLLILSLGYLVATFHVTFRDTQHLLGVFLMLFFYLTPVFYDANIIPARYQTFYRLNPMLHLITAYRTILIQGNRPDLCTLLALGALFGVLLWLGHTVFKRASYRFVEEL